MINISLYQVDAFAHHLFSGNPAGICPLEEWLPDEIMQNIAMENNLAETAFFVPDGTGFHIRWFTPSVEVDLCGHATLASAFILFEHLGWESPEIRFHSKSGTLIVKKEADLLTLNFPGDTIIPAETPVELISAIGMIPPETYKGKTDWMIVLKSQQEVEQLSPNFQELMNLSGRGLIVTAKGDTVDFVSRFFAPQVGVLEDPVTGSAHTTLAPFWADRLGKQEMNALQLSKRGGSLICKICGDRVEISGKAILYMKGTLFID